MRRLCLKTSEAADRGRFLEGVQRGSKGGPEGVQRGSRGGPEGVQISVNY